MRRLSFLSEGTADDLERSRASRPFRRSFFAGKRDVIHPRSVARYDRKGRKGSRRKHPNQTKSSYFSFLISSFERTKDVRKKRRRRRTRWRHVDAYMSLFVRDGRRERCQPGPLPRSGIRTPLRSTHPAPSYQTASGGRFPRTRRSRLPSPEFFLLSPFVPLFRRRMFERRPLEGVCSSMVSRVLSLSLTRDRI